MMSLAEIRLAMTATLFLIGVVASISGLWIIMAKEYHSAMRQLCAQSIRINGRAVTQDTVAPVIDSAARLVEAISQLIRTAAGIPSSVGTEGTTTRSGMAAGAIMVPGAPRGVGGAQATVRSERAIKQGQVGRIMVPGGEG